MTGPQPTGSGCECPPCPGRGNDGHGMTHCAECCFGSGVEADIDCPTHGQKPLLGLRVHLDPALPTDVVELRNYLGETVGRFSVTPLDEPEPDEQYDPDWQDPITRPIPPASPQAGAR